jgi:hypothetical protein
MVARIAARQHGRITRRQLLDAGIDRRRVDRWLSDGRLRSVHRGVYAVGHTAPSTRGDYMAAVLACGEGAVLSHCAAAYLLRLVRRAPPPAVTVPTTADIGRPGVVIHRVATLHRFDASTLDGIPITTVPRVLLDLAPTTAPEQLARLCHEGWIHHGTTPDYLEACIARNRYKPGAKKLRRAMTADVTLSALENQFLRLLKNHNLPLPRTNIDHAGDKVDCHWPDHNLTIELLSYRFHSSRQAFETDVARRRRSNHIAYTYGDVYERPTQTAAEVSALLLSRPA